MGKMDSLLLRSKFRGSMLGALMGDCLGSVYEGEEIFTPGMKLVIQRSFDKLEGPYFKAPVMQFTDDSAMTSAVAESLIEQAGFDQKDMAKKFVKSYFKEPHRGYGAGVRTVFQKLRTNMFVDVLRPAREQFNGEGSLGNGGAMRVTPIALFCYKNYDLMVDVAKKQSQITHTHKTGVDGAILQTIAIHQSLLLDPNEKLDSCKFTDDLIGKMDKIEVDEEGLGLVDPSPYKTQLKLMRDLICEDGDGPHDEKVVHHLGTDIAALHSVPTAIYCFLRAQKPIKDVETDNPLRRTIQYAYQMSGCNVHGSLSNSNISKTLKWSENEVYKLVCWYRKFPCLWRKDISAYADNVARHSAYRSIHEAMNMPNVTFTDVMMKIRETRRSYLNELKKALTAQVTGYTYQGKPNWFNVIHEFLYPYLESNESAELHNINCRLVQAGYFGCESFTKTVIQDIKPLDLGDSKHGGYCSYREELRTKQSFCSMLEEECPLVDCSALRNGPSADWSCLDNLKSLHRCNFAPLSNRSTRLSPRLKYCSPSFLKICIPRNMHSLELPVHCSTNTSETLLKPGDQLILSSVSILSDKSSSTIVCQKRSDYTCTPIKTVTECGVQSTSSNNEKDTKDSAVSVEFDEHDIFSKTIASYLRAMDMETALRAQNQIRKVINDHRLRKPDTQSIRLLRPEIINEKDTTRKGPYRIDKSYDIAVKNRPTQQTYLPRSGHDIKQMGSPKKNLLPNNSALSKARQLKSNIKRPSLAIEPIITPYKRRLPSSTSEKSRIIDKNISLGGDTDTIGSMAGAIAGAFYGEDMISQEILKHCESSSEFRNLADQLFDFTSA